MILRLFARLAIVAPLLGMSHQPATARDWPERAIHVIVPFSAGSAVDTIPRIVLEQLSTAIHQPIVIENRPGAGGTIGAGTVARASADGYTLLATTSSYTIAPSLYPATTYDTLNDFAGIVPLGSVPNVLVVAPSKGFKTLAELVGAARAKPRMMTFASAGIGSATQLSAERFRLRAGLDLIHVPFKGAPEAYTEVMSGRVDFYFGALTSALPLIQDGKLSALAVNSTTRVSVLPDVPTTLEAGFPNSEFTFWIGLFAPAKTPRAVLEQLHDRIEVILQSPSMQEKLRALCVEPMPLSMVDFDKLIRRESDSNREIVKAAGIRPE
jgi:tripartite-type tricarboxylate transporter receptor subunit TctC